MYPVHETATRIRDEHNLAFDRPSLPAPQQLPAVSLHKGVVPEPYAEEGTPDASPLSTATAAATLYQHELKRNFLELLHHKRVWERKITLVSSERPTERNHLIQQIVQPQRAGFKRYISPLLSTS